MASEKTKKLLTQFGVVWFILFILSAFVVSEKTLEDWGFYLVAPIISAVAVWISNLESTQQEIEKQKPAFDKISKSLDKWFERASVPLFLLGFIVVLNLFDWNFLSSKIVVYFVDCETELLKDGYCDKPKSTSTAPMIRIEYVVSTQRQDVIMEFKLEDEKEIERLKDCAVKDRKNWSCSDSGETFGFVDGRPFNRNSIYSDSDIFPHTSRFNWIMASCKQSEDIFLLCVIKTAIFN